MINLPKDITENGIRDILKDIWKKYVPNESLLFIDALSIQQLNTLLNLLDTKDPKGQEKKWSDIKSTINQSKETIKLIIKRANMLRIKLIEKRGALKEEKSLEDLF